MKNTFIIFIISMISLFSETALAQKEFLQGTTENGQFISINVNSSPCWKGKNSLGGTLHQSGDIYTICAIPAQNKNKEIYYQIYVKDQGYVGDIDKSSLRKMQFSF